MTPKKGLGKGLDSLIVNKLDHSTKSNSENDNVSRETIVNINKIEPNKEQPRTYFDEDSLHELADSIKLHGIIQPLIVHKVEDRYEIIAGERRWRAARIAGLKEVPVIIKEYSNQQILEIALIENIQREDLNAIEEAMAYDKLVHEFNLKQDEVAERVGKSRVAVTNSMRLMKLDKRVQQMIIDDMISGGHGRALLGITNKDQQYNVAMKVFDEKLSVRETEKLVKKMLKDKDKPEKETNVSNEDSFIYRDLEDRMKNIFGSKVEIKRQTKDKGKIEIEYYSQEDLDRIIELIGTIG
ncbi:MAG: ParB/RepB/Spo0J family partition protein [Clostridiales bacterium]|nr:ParB/RepB/Spo0J family partition protein [Clostridiales bacterium]